MSCTIIPFPSRNIVRLFKFGRLADYCGLQIHVLADNGVSALVEYEGGLRGWVHSGMLKKYEDLMSGERPSDTEPAA